MPRVLPTAATALLVAVVAGVVSACGGGGGGSSAPTSGRAIFAANCATCHGAQGQGFVGPALTGVATRYPDVETQIALVTNGKGAMPAWGGRLTPAQIRAVTDYTRTGLGG